MLIFLKSNLVIFWAATQIRHPKSDTDLHFGLYHHLETAGHGLAICCLEEKVRILERFHLPTVIEALPVSMEICGEKIISFLVYSPPRQEVSTSIHAISIFRGIWKGEWVVQLGDFDLDQMLPENINRLVVGSVKKDL